ncbi:MAG: hypothetical protein R3315_07985 [Woeseiaceae bacterium]|nr:hypothetical protein [Woeseiaceae bacterium]
MTVQLLALDDAVGLVLPAASADAVRARLQMYRLRSKIELAIDPNFSVSAHAEDSVREALHAAGSLPSEGPLSVAAGSGLVCRRLAEQTIEICGAADAFAAAAIDAAAGVDPVDWDRARILAGLVEIDVDTTERFTPHMINLDRVDAISFSKGCYTGQEVVARTENLGRVKRRINRYRLQGHSARSGERLRDDDREIGEIVNAAGDVCLALVPIDRHDSTLRVGNGTAQPLGLPYPID